MDGLGFRRKQQEEKWDGAQQNEHAHCVDDAKSEREKKRECACARKRNGNGDKE